MRNFKKLGLILVTLTIFVSCEKNDLNDLPDESLSVEESNNSTHLEKRRTVCDVISVGSQFKVNYRLPFINPHKRAWGIPRKPICTTINGVRKCNKKGRTLFLNKRNQGGRLICYYWPGTPAQS